MIILWTVVRCFFIKLIFSDYTEQGVNESTQIRNKLAILFICSNPIFCLLLARNPKSVVSLIGDFLEKL